MERAMREWEQRKAAYAAFLMGVLVPWCWSILPPPLPFIIYAVAIGGLACVTAVLGWRRALPIIAVSGALGMVLITVNALHPDHTRFIVYLTAFTVVAFRIAYSLLLEAVVWRKELQLQK